MMSMFKGALLAVFLMTFSGCAQTSDRVNSLLNASVRRENALVKYLHQALSPTDAGVSVSYYRPCRLEQVPPVLFPKININPPATGLSGIDAVRNILRNNHKISIYKDNKNIIRINIGNMPKNILNTHISNVSLTQLERYNGILSIMKILGSPSVTSIAHEYNVNFIPLTAGYLLTTPAPGLPHMPEKMDNITVADALDKVARTFDAYIIYGMCQSHDGSRYVYAHIARPISDVAK